MDILWSPWRSEYIEGFKDETSKKEECFFCGAIENPHQKNERLVVHRAEHCIVMMNKYPYNSGHLLVAPLRHIGEFQDLNSAELTNIMAMLQLAEKILNDLYKPQGFNIGANLGRAAGAGVPSHLHFHILPRWYGDTNFMATIGDIKVVSESIAKAHLQIAEAFLTYQQ
jgi:ATP adenylyltransferase